MKQILFPLLLMLLLLAGCAEQADSVQEIEEEIIVDQELLDEFNQHKDLYEKDVTEAEALMAAIDDEQSTTDYLDFASKQINHLNAFYMFFEANKAELKKSGIDTFTWNNNIVDTADELKSKTAELGYPID